MITGIVILFIVELLVLTALVHTENTWYGSLSLIVAALVYSAIAGTDGYLTLWQTIAANPSLAILYVVGYLVLGVLWSFFKYLVYIRKEKRKGVSLADLERRNDKSRIMVWMAYWPVSIIGYFLGDWLYNVYQWLYEKVSGIYPKIRNMVFKNA